MPQLRNPDLDGTYAYLLPNGNNLLGKLAIESGATPKVFLQSAGSGIELRSAAGAVILNVPETGFVVPTQTFVQLVPQASAPAGMTEGAIWYNSTDHAWHGLDDTGDVTFVTQ